MDKEGIYRSRLSKGYGKDVLNFVSSLKEDIWFANEDIDGTEAHVIMLAENKILTKADLKSILIALETIRKELSTKKFQINPKYEDIHEYIEHQVVTRTGIKHGGKMQTGRSRNDQIATDLRLKIRSEIVETSKQILSFTEMLYSLALKEKNTIVPLYTHSQHAQVGILAHYFTCYVESLFRGYRRLIECFRRVNLSPLGSCAVGGTSFPVNRSRTMKLLGFTDLIDNSLDAVSSRDFVIETLSHLSSIMVDLTRIVEDLILWSTKEFGYLELADEYSSTSSVLPQKKNPDPLELIRGRAGSVFSSLFNLLIQMKALPSGYNRDLQESKVPLRVSFEVVQSSLNILTSVFKTMTINRDRLLERTSTGFSTAIDLAEGLSLQYDIPFRESHKIVGKLVMTLISRGLTMNHLTPQEVIQTVQEQAGITIGITSDELQKYTDPQIAVTLRRSQGSSSPVEILKLLQKQKHYITQYKKEVAALEKNLEQTHKKLRKEVNKYLN